jgi:UDP-N-acetylmuramoylalanine--D-glutamate ligase
MTPSLDYSGQKVLIFGLGLHGGGVGSARFFASHGATVKVTDLKTEAELSDSLAQLTGCGISYTLGHHDYADIDWADLVVRNPAVKDDNPYIQYALQNHKRVEQDIGIFLQHVQASQMIGITGTKGKSTTTSLIAHILQTNGVSHIVAGNIGVSVLDSLPNIHPNDLVVLELSSFQLQAFHQHRFSPHIAIITTISEDHINYHGSMEAYIQAKRAITAYQTLNDVLFITKDDPITTQPQFLQGLTTRIIACSDNNLPTDLKPTIPGRHNRHNISLALAVADYLQLDHAVTLQALATYQGPPYRLQTIRQWHGATVINDSAATSPTATRAALQAFPQAIVIIGGVDKNLDYTQLAADLSRSAKAIILLSGSATDKLLPLLTHPRISGPYSSLDQAAQAIIKLAEPGDTVLFSPAAASFNMFKHEFDRGEQFTQLIQDLAD